VHPEAGRPANVGAVLSMRTVKLLAAFLIAALSTAKYESVVSPSARCRRWHENPLPRATARPLPVIRPPAATVRFAAMADIAPTLVTGRYRPKTGRIGSTSAKRALILAIGSMPATVTNA